MQQEVTIADMLSTPGDVEEYVRRVLETLGMVGVHGEVGVRIGIKGTGFQPNYRINHAGEPSRSISAFDAASHKPFTNIHDIHTENRSTRSTTYEGILALLGRISCVTR